MSTPVQIGSTFIGASLGANPRLGTWIRFEDDHTVSIFTGKVDIGQGISTALLQIAADELDVSPERIRIVRPSTAGGPNEGFTAGSLSIQDSGTAIRFACADARGILLRNAARRLEASLDDLVVIDGAIGVAGTDVRTSYWECVDPAMYDRVVAGDIPTKPPTAYSIVGTSFARRDLPAKFTGKPSYVQDLVLPDMLFGRVVRPARPGAKLVTCDRSVVPAGVRVVRDGSFLGVLADREEVVVKARSALAAACTWSGGDRIPAPDQLLARVKGDMARMKKVIDAAGISAK